MGLPSYVAGSHSLLVGYYIYIYIYIINIYLRRGDESQELVGTGRREWRGWEGFRRGLVEEAAVRGYIECRFGIREEREGMCRRLDILYLALHMWHFTFHTGLVRR